MTALIEALADRTIAVYGGTGLIGYALASRLHALGVPARNVYLIARHAPRASQMSVQYVHASVLDSEAMSRVPRADLAVYIAGSASSYAADPLYTVALATNGVANFLRTTSDVQRRLIISSTRVYGPREDLTVLDEHAECRLRSPDCRNIYDASKLVSEALAHQASTAKRPVSIVRLANVYGGHAKQSTTAFHEFVAHAAASRRIVIRGAPGSIRNHVHVDDACDGILHTLAFGASGAAYNIGSMDHLSTHDFVCRIVAAMPFQVEVEQVAPDAVPDHVVISIARARSELAYIPAHRVDESLAPAVIQALEACR